jgi:membrane protein YdbS with pleckstrin-like domain
MAEPDVTVEDAFAPPGEPWCPVSPRLATARRLTMLLVLVPLVVVVSIVLVLMGAEPLLVALPAVVGVVLAIWSWWLIGRRVRSFGYAERADDLLVTSGIMFRRLVVVPYGRMQLVDITAGPIDRALGVATVQLHTAAASTNATIPGLPPAEASGLRDRLAARGEQRSAGL